MGESRDLAAEATALAERCRAAGRLEAAAEIESCVRTWPSTTEALIDPHDTLHRLSRTERNHLPRHERRAMRSLARAARIGTGLVPAWRRVLWFAIVLGAGVLLDELLRVILDSH